MALFVRVMMDPFGPLFDQWQQIIIVVCDRLSMVLGAFAAINQTNIKRLMAYSSIGHMGYVLVGLAAGTAAGCAGIVIYMTIYSNDERGHLRLHPLHAAAGPHGRGYRRPDKGLSKTNPLMAAMALAIFMFSMAGIPPLAGLLRQALRLPGGDRGGALHARRDRRAEPAWSAPSIIYASSS